MLAGGGGWGVAKSGCDLSKARYVTALFSAGHTEPISQNGLQENWKSAEQLQPNFKIFLVHPSFVHRLDAKHMLRHPKQLQLRP